MTGNELLRARNALGISQASAAGMVGGLGGATAATSVYTAANIANAENGGASTISDGILNAACESVFRKYLNSLP